MRIMRGPFGVRAPVLEKRSILGSWRGWCCVWCRWRLEQTAGSGSTHPRGRGTSFVWCGEVVGRPRGSRFDFRPFPPCARTDTVGHDKRRRKLRGQRRIHPMYHTNGGHRLICPPEVGPTFESEVPCRRLPKVGAGSRVENTLKQLRRS